MIEIDDNEKIIRVVHKHWIVLIGDILMLIVAVAVPMILLFVFHLLPIEKLLAFKGSIFDAGGFFLFGWLMIVWMLAWNIWTDYYLDVLIITDKRVFDIKQEGLFKRESSSFRIDRIQNITVDMKGVIQTLLDFGAVRIETAGENEDFVFPYLAQPYDIKKFINEMQDSAIDKSQLVHLDPTSIGNQEIERLIPSPSAAEKLRKSDDEGL